MSNIAAAISPGFCGARLTNMPVFESMTPSASICTRRLAGEELSGLFVAGGVFDAGGLFSAGGCVWGGVVCGPAPFEFTMMFCFDVDVKLIC